MAVFRLKDILPFALESLTIYEYKELVKNERFGE